MVLIVVIMFYGSICITVNIPKLRMQQHLERKAEI